MHVIISQSNNIKQVADNSEEAKLGAFGLLFYTSRVLNCESLKPCAEWNTFEKTKVSGCSVYNELEWIKQLNKMENKTFSQFGEDGITVSLFNKIGHGNKYFVEFGVQNGEQCNSRILREKHSWKGILFDNNFKNLSININQESLWVDNIVYKFKQHKIPTKFDLLSIDTDFAELWLLSKILNASYQPRVIIVEINQYFGPYGSLSIPLLSAKRHETWHGTRWHGTSILATAKLAKLYGFELIYLTNHALNAYFVHKSELNNMDVSLAAWVEQVSLAARKIKWYRHKPDPYNRAFHHICANMPCRSSLDW